MGPGSDLALPHHELCRVVDMLYGKFTTLLASSTHIQLVMTDLDLALIQGFPVSIRYYGKSKHFFCLFLQFYCYLGCHRSPDSPFIVPLYVVMGSEVKIGALDHVVMGHGAGIPPAKKSS